ncbi:hypothetical protein [Tenacibaculum xiamenense]|uniref:hypothetical protein n=1 Tax=Tenacibaculum xiamenense TaxID=1261553 RepID=UPI003893E47A
MKNYCIYAIVLILFACKPQEKKKEETKVKIPSITAVPMPSTLVSGQNFPTDSTTINNWVAESKIVNNLETNKDIITHGWDIWNALTEETDQKNNDQPLRRFETWYTPQDIQKALKAKTLGSAIKLNSLDRFDTGNLEIPHQNQHGLKVRSSDVVGFVKCDPSSAQHIYDKELYFFEVLKSMIRPGKITNIPAFPASSVLIKPVFYPLTKTDSLSPNTYSLPVWPGYHGQVPMDSIIKNGFGSNSWNNNITITTTGKTDKEKKVYSINDFIHFKLSKTQANNIVNVIDNGKAKEGDYAVLVAMHVNTRENRRWTWQTFWWSENPNSPQSPSSSNIAELKPSTLDRASKHYSMALAYNMISPAQPYSGGSNAITDKEPKKESIYAFNPYLEAGFNADTFDVSASSQNPNNSGGNDTIRKYYNEGYQKVGAIRLSEKVYEGGKLNRVGIETNCMSCHGQARLYDVKSIEDSYQYYITDQYFDLDAPYFKSTVVLDFAWSIQGSLIYKDSIKK